MSTPKFEQNSNDHEQYESIDSWTWIERSASRHPTYNTVNVSSAELGAMGRAYAKAPVMEAPAYAVGNLRSAASPADYHAAPTYASSARSIDAPEGPERMDPNIATTRADTFLSNGQLTLGPETGFNEQQHRRSSFHDELSVPLHMFLQDLENNRAFQRYVTQRGPEQRFLQQDPFLRSATSMEVKKGSSGTKISQASIHNSGFLPGDASYGAYDTADPLAGAGRWDESRAEEYPQLMTESALED
ncbi:hypothetical protein BP5796_04106 [Coleophoma crateriformis]|uniref:Uncharacterized protein n=1 Tax=Coleophoma crateriformis TaxID=565419 RepID=A0A3D8SHY4_9HELO|nr:hypothetical protein BP5796_04106 [Coleophoma crateriformis]